MSLPHHIWTGECTRLATHAALFLLFTALLELALVVGVIGPPTVFGGLVGITAAGAYCKISAIHGHLTGRIPMSGNDFPSTG
ncbi:hypothetical protein [Kutzneria buriramensis]|uniref:Uncharacterized protein n=1 Tax=Kutzneria buriramensis TaxID=1045776 RepID=A0A3E0G5U8_9PSEU|nr:hypothetical protein [Kutzneria buriramensis]REH18063.1 hypothetical protein BCF44_13850 [Kutzneria buriramensis]